uniref:Uncharacterized protein n=1 Tax=viral metagenome TaxID=1070528 RepID=A0A6C0JV10_9ZZZZ
MILEFPEASILACEIMCISFKYCEKDGVDGVDICAELKSYKTVILAWVPESDRYDVLQKYTNLWKNAVKT